MGRVYQAVRGVVQGSLHRSKPDTMASARASGNDTSLNDAMEFEKIFVDGIGRFKAAVSDEQAVIANGVQAAEQVIEGVKATITGLEAKLRETEEALRRKDVANQKMEETLNAEIRDLQSALKKKHEALESRDSEINDLKSNRVILAEQVTRLALAIQQVKAEAASEAQHAEQVIAGFKSKIATMEVQLTQPGQPVGRTDRTKGLDQDRDGQVINLNAELKPQTNGTKKMSAEALADIQAQDIGTRIAPEQLKTAEGKLATSCIVIQEGLKTVSQDTFDRMIAAFSELANVMGSIATLIIRDHVRVLGESMEEFPQRRFTELLDSLGGQITDDKLKADFRERFNKA